MTLIRARKWLVGMFLAVLVCFTGVSEAGLFDGSKPAGYGLYEISKPESEGDLADGIQVMSGLAVELLSDIWGFVYLEYGVAGDNRGVAGTGGISANIKKLSDIRKWGYQPHQEINIGLCGAFRPEDKCWLAGLYASIGWGRN